MTYRIVPRTEYGLPAVVTSANGVVRPPLSLEPYITAHYTGNNVDYTGKVTAAVVRQIQTVFSKSKPFEYNYVIGQEEDDLIFEFAGKFQAAHSGGENEDSFGVLFLLGVGEVPTERMIDKWRWLRDTLVFDGSLRVNVAQKMHFQMPGAATACPGNGVISLWPQFLLPWVDPTPPPAPIIETDEDEDMSKPVALIKFGTNPHVYAQWAGFKTWIDNGNVLNSYKFVYQMEVKELPGTMPDFFASSGPIVGPWPPGVDGYGRPV